MNTVSVITKNNLCCSCGICKSVCPVEAINYVKEKGKYIPQISQECVNCGKCASVCPSYEHNYSEKNLPQAIQGTILKTVNAWSKDEKIRHYGASSGMVTTLVKILLEKNIYDCVFTLDTYDYSKQLKTHKYDKNTYILEKIEKQSFSKSRYLPVSHEELIKYILKNKSCKVIIIGTSCALRGILNVIEKFKLNRENYLLIGLFCESVMNYNIYDYYADNFTDEKKLTALHFKNKDSGGWPGNMKLMFSDGSSKFIDKKNRTDAKPYFQIERCLYCLDKLNVCADISFGDNYTDQNSSLLGSNSVIVRSQTGLSCFTQLSEYFDYEDVDIEKVLKAQYVNDKINNYCFSLIKRKKSNVMLNSDFISQANYSDYYLAYSTRLNNIKSGERYLDNKDLLLKRIKDGPKKHSFFKRTIDFIRRRFLSK